MDSDYLKACVEKELTDCRTKIQQISNADADSENGLRFLYGLPNPTKPEPKRFMRISSSFCSKFCH